MPVCLGSCCTWGLAVRTHRHLCGVSTSQVARRGSLCGHVLAAFCFLVQNRGHGNYLVNGFIKDCRPARLVWLAVSSVQAHPLGCFTLRVSRLSSCSLSPPIREARGIPVSTEDEIGSKMKTSS